MTAADQGVNVTAACPERLAGERIEAGELSHPFLAQTPLRPGPRLPREGGGPLSAPPEPDCGRRNRAHRAVAIPVRGWS